MSVATQVAIGGGSTGGTSAGVILLNMWLKHHGHAALQPEEAVAVVGVVSPVIHIAVMILLAILMKILGWLSIEIPGLQKVEADAASSVSPEDFQAALNAIRAETAKKIEQAAAATKAASVVAAPPPAPKTPAPAPIPASA